MKKKIFSALCGVMLVAFAAAQLPISFWDASSNGIYSPTSSNVGIGTTDSPHRLTIAGSVFDSVNLQNGATAGLYIGDRVAEFGAGVTVDGGYSQLLLNDFNHLGLTKYWWAVGNPRTGGATIVGDSNEIRFKVGGNAAFVYMYVDTTVINNTLKITKGAGPNAILTSDAIGQCSWSSKLNGVDFTEYFLHSDTISKLTSKSFVQNSYTPLVSSGINSTAGDSATINFLRGRFRKDTSGNTFTLTNCHITISSIITLTLATPGLTAGYQISVQEYPGSAIIFFETAGVGAAPSTNVDINFVVSN